MQRQVALSAAAGCVVIGLLAAMPRVAQAASFASGITEAAGNVTYTLNEGGTVTIIRDGVADAPVTAAKGTNTFARNGAANYQIMVTQTAADGYQSATATAAVGQPTLVTDSPLSGASLQISDDTNPLLRFNSPRGITINNNPANGALFGRVYVSNSAAGTLAVSGAFPARTLTDGIYILRADQSDAVGQGDTARDGGLGTVFSASTNSPWKTSIDADGNVYISDASAAGTVYRADADVTAAVNLLVGTGSANPVNPSATLNHGTLYQTYVTGSAAAGNLTMYTVDQDLTPASPASATQLNSLWRYDLGSTTSGYSGTPTQLVQKTIIDNVANAPEIDFTRGPDGKFYLMQNRTDGTEAGLFVVSADGQTKLFDTLTESTNLGLDASGVVAGTEDVIRQVRGVAIRGDNHYMGLVTNLMDAFVVPLIDGIPDVANRTYVHAFGNGTLTLGRDVEFDAAGNLYVAASGSGAMRIFSPGTLSQTVYNSNGTFTVINEPSFNGSGNLSDSSKWLLGVTANGNEAVATLGNLTGGTQTVTVDTGTALSRLRFSGGNYTVAGSNTITMGAGKSEPRIIAETGNQTITAPISIMTQAGSTTNYQGFGVAAYAGATLTLTNVTYQAFGSYKMTKWSDGTVIMPTFLEGKLDIKGGTLRFSTPATGTGAYTNALQIAGTPAAPTATLDLGSSGIVDDYPNTATTSPLADVTSLVKSGYNNGTWTGKGITSLRAANDSRYAIGILDVASLNLPVDSGTGNLVTPTSYLNGVPVIDPSNLVLMVTLKGDADLSGSVNFTDLLALAKHYGTADGTATWTGGDSNYDGNVNFTDLLALAKNYNQTLSADQSAELGSSFTTDFALAQALAPEPASLSVILGVGALALRRRRGNSR